MICEKCGSNNPKNSAVCTKCGAKMPNTEICGGFADILSYKGPVSVDANVNGVDDKTIQKLERKVNAALQTGRKLTVLTFVSLAISVFAIAFAVLTSFGLIGCSKETVIEGTTSETPVPSLDDVADLPEFKEDIVDSINK